MDLQPARLTWTRRTNDSPRPFGPPTTQRHPTAAATNLSPVNFGDSPRPGRTGTRRSATDAPPSAHRRRTRLQPRPGWAAGAGGAVDRTSGQCLVAAPLARAVVL